MIECDNLPPVHRVNTRIIFLYASFLPYQSTYPRAAFTITISAKCSLCLLRHNRLNLKKTLDTVFNSYTRLNLFDYTAKDKDTKSQKSTEFVRRHIGDGQGRTNGIELL